MQSSWTVYKNPKYLRREFKNGHWLSHVLSWLQPRLPTTNEQIWFWNATTMENLKANCRSIYRQFEFPRFACVDLWKNNNNNIEHWQQCSKMATWRILFQLAGTVRKDHGCCKRLRNGWALLRSNVQPKFLKSVKICFIFNHPCSFMVYYSLKRFSIFVNCYYFQVSFNLH